MSPNFRSGMSNQGKIYCAHCIFTGEFCREYGLERKSLTKVIKGKAKHHKGWTVPQGAQDT